MSLANWFRKATRAPRRAEADHELNEELQFHVERRAEELQRDGYSAREARRRALVELGGTEQIREEVRAMRPGIWLDTLWQDMRYAARQLRRNPGFTAVAILTLALGIGATTAVFTVVKRVLLSSLPYTDPERLVTLAATSGDTLNPENVSFGESREWAARSHSFDSVALYRGWRPTLTGTDRPQVLSGMRVTHNFFSTLGVSPIVGRDFYPDDDQPQRWRVLLISDGFWKRQFGGDPSIVGRTIQLNDRSFEIAGILPEDFRSLMFSDGTRQPDVWAPLGYSESDPFACRSCWHLKSVARLRQGVSLARAREEMGAIATQVAWEFPQDLPQDEGALLLPLRERLVGHVRRPLLLLMGATILVVLIGCTNIANLVMARNTSRRREIALRVVLGAERRRIIRQLLTESLMLSLLGGVAGIILAWWGVDVLVQAAPREVPRLDEVKVDFAVLCFTSLVSVLTGLTIGLLPALQAARQNQREALQKGHSSAGLPERRVRSLLVVSEVGLAFVLTVAAGLLLRSFLQVTRVDPGFVTQNVRIQNFSLVGAKYAEDAQVLQFGQAVLDRISVLPEVEAAALVSTLPLGGSYDRRGFHIQDRALASVALAPSVDGYYVSANYFAALGIPLKRGRLFNATDEAHKAAHVAVISESAAREIFPGEDPIGRKAIQLGGRHEDRPWATIVGVVGDVHQYRLDSASTPQAYLLHTYEPQSFPVLVVRLRQDVPSIPRTIEREIHALDKDVPVYGAASMEDLLSASLAQRRFLLALLSAFGCVALLLAGIGIYGVMACAVNERRREVAVRIAMGAERAHVFGLIVGRGAKLALIGVLAGVAGALALTDVLSAQLFEVRPSDPATFALVAFGLVLISILSCAIPGRRAAAVNPAEVLRHE